MIRLNKIIKQYNIGLETLVEFLATQGLAVEPNPNAKISEEYLPAIHAQFGKEVEQVQAANDFLGKIREESASRSMRQSDQFDWGLFNQEEENSSDKNKRSAKEENPLVNLTMNQKKVILQRIANSLNMDVIVSLKEKKK